MYPHNSPPHLHPPLKGQYRLDKKLFRKYSLVGKEGKGEDVIEKSLISSTLTLPSPFKGEGID